MRFDLYEALVEKRQSMLSFDGILLDIFTKLATLESWDFPALSQGTSNAPLLKRVNMFQYLGR